MTQARSIIVTAAVVALTFGVTGKTLSPVEQDEPLSTADILIVTNDSGSAAGQSEDSADRPDHRNPTADYASGAATDPD